MIECVFELVNTFQALFVGFVGASLVIPGIKIDKQGVHFLQMRFRPADFRFKIATFQLCRGKKRRQFTPIGAIHGNDILKTGLDDHCFRNPEYAAPAGRFRPERRSVSLKFFQSRGNGQCKPGGIQRRKKCERRAFQCLRSQLLLLCRDALYDFHNFLCLAGGGSFFFLHSGRRSGDRLSGGFRRKRLRFFLCRLYHGNIRPFFFIILKLDNFDLFRSFFFKHREQIIVQGRVLRGVFLTRSEIEKHLSIFLQFRHQNTPPLLCGSVMISYFR